MNPETAITNAILALSRGNVRLFRNNTGVGWAGKLVGKEGRHTVIADARPLRAGLVVGSSDIIGWTSVVITAEMVGMKLAVFTAIEVKTKQGRATDEQSNFIRNVLAAGGFAGVARNEQEARNIVNGHSDLDLEGYGEYRIL